MKENQKEEQKADPLWEISSITLRRQIFLFPTRRRKELRDPLPSEKGPPVRVGRLGASKKQHFLGSMSSRELPRDRNPQLCKGSSLEEMLSLAISPEHKGR